MRSLDALICDAGPNNWDDIASTDFGPEHDFTVDDEGTIVIITQVSEAAKQWLYAHLPEDCPRWGAGFAIEHRYAKEIIEGMQNAGLMSLEDYDEAMNELNQIQFNS